MPHVDIMEERIMWIAQFIEGFDPHDPLACICPIIALVLVVAWVLL